MTAILHTILRNEIYHFNYRMNGKIYRKTLRTDSPSTCREYVSGIMVFINKVRTVGRTVMKSDLDEFIEMLISNKLNEVLRIGKAMTEPLSATANTYFEQWFLQTESIRYSQYNYDNTDWGYAGITPPNRPDFPKYGNWLSTQLASVSKRSEVFYQFASYNFEMGQTEMDTTHPFYDDFNLPTVHQEKHSYLDGIVTGHVDNIIKANKAGNTVRVRHELDELKRKFSSLLPDTPPEIVIPVEESLSPHYEDITDELTEYIYGLEIKKNTMANKKAAMKDFAPAFNGLRLDQITFEEIENAWKVLLYAPKLNLGSEYGFEAENKAARRELRWQMVESGEIDITTVPEDHLLSYSSLKDKKAFLSDLFRFAARKRYITINPLELAELSEKPERNTPRVSLPKATVSAIVGYVRENLSNPYSWVILIAAYHGLRPAEICSLVKEQIVRDSDTDIYYIHIKAGKTANTPRKVPIHKAILLAGFLEYIDQIPNNQPIFPFHRQHITNYFSRDLRDRFSIPEKNEAGELQNLYSLRHNVISQLVTCPPEIKYFLIGHTQGTTSGKTTKGYTHDYLNIAQQWINKVSYHN